MRRVRALLMGGQACILYGAAEFSRDIDLAILTDPYNKVKFWLLELRTPDLLIETAGQHPHACRRLMRDRPLLAHALSGDSRKIAEELDDEKEKERELDRRYWAPLRREMEAMRLSIKKRPD
jgi:hypothetical protein